MKIKRVIISVRHKVKWSKKIVPKRFHGKNDSLGYLQRSLKMVDVINC